MTPNLGRFPVARKVESVDPPANSRFRRLAGFISDRSHLWYFLAVVTLLAVAFYLRTWGNLFGLPYFFHPDEQAVVDRSLAIMRTGDFNPHWFNYPSLYIYLQAIADMFVFLATPVKQAENLILPTTPGFDYMRVGRTVSAIAGTATVLAVYYAGRSLFSARVGLISATLFTFSLLHTINSHYITTDVPMTLLATLSFLASAQVLRTGQNKYYVLAGLTAGLAASTKYNGGLAIVSLVAAHLFVAWRQRSPVNLGLVAAIAFFAVGFFLGTPYALLDLPNFLKGFAAEIAHYSLGHETYEGSNNLVWYFQTVLISWDSVALVFGLAGAIICVLRRRGPHYLLIAFPLVYIWWMGRFVVHFERNLVPLTPFVALLAAVFIDLPLRRLAMSWRLFRPVAALLVVCLVGLAITPSLLGIVEFNDLLTAKHPKTIAAEWANSNLPHGSKIAVELYGIPLEPKSYQLVNVLSVADRSVEWYKQQQFDYVIVSDGVWIRYYLEPEKYPKDLAAYEAIFNRLKLVKAVELPAMSERLSIYPTVEVYHLPRVRIYKVEEKTE
ncbi:MAG: glycosyltransferase family 39 protein [Dehalococcoidia bacterium]|nr:glycosyltransferase family 39 protein [Dehalococcoidia bacterium]